MHILDIVKVLEMTISISSFLRSSLQLSAYKGQSSNTQGQENLLKTLAYEMFLKLIWKGSVKNISKQNVDY